MVEFGIGKNESNPLQRTEIRSEQHLTPTNLPKAAGDSGQTELELKIRRHVILTGGAGKLNVAVVRGCVFRALVYFDLLFGGDGVAR